MALKRSERRRQPGRLGVTLGLASLVLVGCAAQAGSSFDPNQETVLPSTQLQYESMNPMIKMAPAWGDRTQGAHGTFGQFAANFVTPVHSHTAAYHGVVLAGVMTNPFAGEESPPRMDPGSYWFVPADAAHATACVSDTPCAFYFHSKDAFDFTSSN